MKSLSMENGTFNLKNQEITRHLIIGNVQMAQFFDP